MRGREPRIGDAERDAAVTALGEHYAAGRLTKQEYDERSDVALRARTDAELRPLFLDLPRSTATRQAPRRPNHPRADQPRLRQQIPLIPVLAVLTVVAALASGAGWLLFIVGWLFCCGPRRHWR
jgi:hypothetical protein